MDQVIDLFYNENSTEQNNENLDTKAVTKNLDTKAVTKIIEVMDALIEQKNIAIDPNILSEIKSDLIIYNEYLNSNLK